MLSRLILHRYTIVAISIFLLIVSSYTIFNAFMLLSDTENSMEGLDALFDGAGVIFIAYGCALEGRGILMNFLKVYPRYQNETEEAVDRLCEFYGLLLVVGGLLMEVAADIVAIPSRFINIANVEVISFAVGFISWLVVVWVILRICIRLVAVDPSKVPPT